MAAELFDSQRLIEPEPERIGRSQIAGFAQRLEDLPRRVLARLLEHDELRPVGLGLAILALFRPQGLDLLVGGEQGIGQDDLVATRSQLGERLLRALGLPDRGGVSGLGRSTPVGEVGGQDDGVAKQLQLRQQLRSLREERQRRADSLQAVGLTVLLPPLLVERGLGGPGLPQGLLVPRPLLAGKLQVLDPFLGLAKLGDGAGDSLDRVRRP